MTAVDTPLDPATAAPHRPADVASVGPSLEATGLVKRFGQTEALRGVDVASDPAEIVAVMGPSGSGQVDTAPLPGRDPGAGRGRRSSSMAPGSTCSRESERSRLRRTAFGFVFQFGQLVPELPAVENAALPLLLNGQRGRRRDPDGEKPGWTDSGSRGLDDRRPGELSGGQAQRVAIARALVDRSAGRVRGRAHGLARLPGRRAGHEPPDRCRAIRRSRGDPGHP